MKCAICGKEINKETCFSYIDEKHNEQRVRDLCRNLKCVNKYAEKYSYTQELDYEALAEKQQGELWDDSALWKEA